MLNVIQGYYYSGEEVCQLNVVERKIKSNQGSKFCTDREEAVTQRRFEL